MLYMNMEFSSLINNLDKSAAKPLTSIEVQDIARPCWIIQYPQLAEMDTIDDLFNNSAATVILYLTQKNYGHWVCIFRQGDGLEFFDSYGFYPDNELEFTPDYFRRENNMEYPHLTYLLSKYNGPIEYNEYAYQQDRPGISTCGRHCGIRLRHRGMDNKEYKDHMLALLNSSPFNNFDELVTYLTDKILSGI